MKFLNNNTNEIPVIKKTNTPKFITYDEKRVFDIYKNKTKLFVNTLENENDKIKYLENGINERARKIKQMEQEKKLLIEELNKLKKKEIKHVG